MINEANKKKIHSIWNNYLKTDKQVLDTKGNELVDIDKSRNIAVKELQKMIAEFEKGSLNIYEFKTTIDSYNKRNNLWGFTATKGQMFFNQLVKYSESKIDALTLLLKQSISKPKNLEDALSKIEALEKYCLTIFNKAKDKRKAPNPKSVGYFLSYFWQVHDANQWPIFYTSLINAYKELNIWEDKSNQKESYEFFYQLNEEIKTVLKKHTNKTITNWDAEHAFWNFNGNPNKPKTKKVKPIKVVGLIEDKIIPINSSFALSDYLIPKVSKLVELGSDTNKSSATKGSEFEKLVAEIFNLMDFEVEFLGQGSGRNPDAILRHREDNTAFLVDAKAYSKGYSLGIDDRAIKEYINYYCPKLQKEGYKKIGFIIVSNSFKSNFDSFINDITWYTDIKRFILLTSEALLYLLAYKTKDRLSLSTMIESLIGFANPVEANNIIEEFDDV